MGEYSDKEWYLKEKAKYFSKYGEIPPHWVVFPNSHPYSIMWRMGGGETFVMVFSNWFEDTFNEEKNRVQFFLKYPPPPRWLAVMSAYIWNVEIEEEFEKSEILERLNKFGFLGTDEYLKDLENPKWLD